MRQVYLDDKLIAQMIQDPRVVKLLPGLQSIRLALDKLNSKDCHKCAATKKRERINALRLAKQYILQANADTRSRLKALLRVDQIKIVEKAGAGKPILRII